MTQAVAKLFRIGAACPLALSIRRTNTANAMTVTMPGPSTDPLELETSSKVGLAQCITGITAFAAEPSGNGRSAARWRSCVR